MNEERNLLSKLIDLGIYNPIQLEEYDIFYWWQKKFREIQKDNLKNQNELLININNAKEELENIDKLELVNILKNNLSHNQTSKEKEKEKEKVFSHKISKNKEVIKSIFAFKFINNKKNNFTKVGNAKERNLRENQKILFISVILPFILFVLGFYIAAISKLYVREEPKNTLNLTKSRVEIKLFKYLATKETEKGKEKYKNGDFSGAIKHFTEAIRINPDHKLNYLYRGNSKIKLDDYKGACEDYKIGLRDYIDKDHQIFLQKGIGKKEIINILKRDCT